METNGPYYQECINTFTQILETSRAETRYYILAGRFGCGKSTLVAKLRSVCTQEKIDQSSFDLAKITTVDDYVQAFLTSTGLGLDLSLLNSALLHDDSFSDLPIFSTLDDQAIAPHKASSSALLESCAELVNHRLNRRKLVLFFDHVEAHPTLLSLLYDHFLNLLSNNVIVVLASRKASIASQILPAQSTSYFHLHPLSTDESIKFLQARGVQFEQAITVSKLVQGNLFLLGMAALGSDLQLGEAQSSEMALIRDGIERALREAPDQHLITLIRLASIARWFNLEVLRRLSSSGNVEMLYSRLVDLSFFQEIDGGLQFDVLLHTLLYKQWHLQTPKRFNELNARVLNYYSSIADIVSNERYYRLVVERVYHTISASELQGLEEAAEQAMFAAFNGDSFLCGQVRQVIASFPARINALPAWLDFHDASCERARSSWVKARTVLEARLRGSGVVTLEGGYLTIALATTFQEMGSWLDAERTARDALTIFRSVGSRDGSFFAHAAIANAATYQHKRDLALEELSSAQNILKQVKSDVKECVLLMCCAELERTQGRWESAANMLSSLSKLAEQFHNDNLKAEILAAKGKLYRDRQDWSRAQTCFAECVQMSRKTGNVLTTAKALHSMGTISVRQGYLDNAVDYYTESLVIKRKLGDIYGIAKAQIGLGHIERLRGNLRTALDYYVGSQQLLSQISNMPKLGRVSCRIGMTLHELGDWDRAIVELESSKRVRLSYGDYQGVSECYSELGRVFESKGATAQAIEHYELGRTYAGESDSFSRQILPIVQLTALALRRLSTPLGSHDYVQLARQITDSSHQYKLLSQLYQERALRELENGYERSCFALLTESVYVAAHNDDCITRLALQTFWNALSTLAATSLTDAVIDYYCHRSLEYWARNCGPSPIDSIVWKQLTSPDARNAMQVAGNSAKFIRELISQDEM